MAATSRARSAAAGSRVSRSSASRAARSCASGDMLERVAVARRRALQDVGDQVGQLRPRSGRSGRSLISSSEAPLDHAARATPWPAPRGCGPAARAARGAACWWVGRDRTRNAPPGRAVPAYAALSAGIIGARGRTDRHRGGPPPGARRVSAAGGRGRARSPSALGRVLAEDVTQRRRRAAVRQLGDGRLRRGRRARRASCRSRASRAPGSPFDGALERRARRSGSPPARWCPRAPARWCRSSGPRSADGAVDVRRARGRERTSAAPGEDVARRRRPCSRPGTELGPAELGVLASIGRSGGALRAPRRAWRAGHRRRAGAARATPPAPGRDLELESARAGRPGGSAPAARSC